MIRFGGISSAALLIALAAPTRAVSHELDGNWTLSLIHDGVYEHRIAIVKIQVRDGRPTGETVAASPIGPLPAMSLKSVTKEDKLLRLALSNKFQEVIFDGVLPKGDAKRVVGCLSIDNAVYPNPAWLAKTDETMPDRLFWMQPVECPPMEQGRKLTSKALILRTRATQTKDAEQKRALLSQAEAAEQHARLEAPKHFREVLAKYADSPAVIQAALELVNMAHAIGAKPAEIQAWLQSATAAAKLYSPRLEAEINLQLSERLIAQEELASLAVECARAAEQGLPSTAASDQARLLDLVARGLRKSGKLDEAKTYETRLAKGNAIFLPGNELGAEAENGSGGEGPAWDPKLGVLTSGAGDHIWRLDRAGKLSIWRKNAGTNGLLFDSQGRLVCCEPVERRMTRIDLGGKLTVLTDKYQGKRYNQPNDVTIDSQGRIYFSDPRYGSRDDMQIRDEQGRTIEGVYRIDPDGAVTRILGREVDRPNGVLIAADDRWLFVADNNNSSKEGARKLWRFDLKKDGSVDFASRKLLYDWGLGRGPDGVKQDREGRLYVAGGLNKPNPPFEPAEDKKGGIYVIDPKDGKLLAFLPVPRDEVTNCAFGGDDLRTLYITGGGTLYSIRTTTPGRVLWPKTP